METSRSSWPRFQQTPVELAGFVLVVCVGLMTILLAGPGYVANDGAQYLSTIEQILAGNGIRTSAIYYEVQAQFGMPALQTVWPPGLPLLAAGVSLLTGLSGLHAVALISAVAHCGTAIAIFWLCARLLAGDRVSAVIVAVAYVLYVPALTLTIEVLSEPLFIAGLVAGACLLHAGLTSRTERERLALFAAASLCVGLACTFRYLGIAFVGALGLVGIWQIVRGRMSPASFKAGVALVVPAIVIVALLLGRNYAITGRLTGGPEGPRALEFGEIVLQSRWAIQVLLGDTRFWHGKLLVAFFVLGAGGWVAVRLSAQDWGAYLRRDERVGVAILAFLGSAATVALLLMMTLRKTGVMVEARYLVPCVPMLLIGVAALWPRDAAAASLEGFGRRWRSAAIAGTALVTCGYLAAFSEFARQGAYPARLEAILSQKVGTTSARDLLRAAASTKSPVMSNQSQALHVVLGRPTLGIAERRLTSRVWSAEDVRQQAANFGVEYVVVFPTLPQGNPAADEDYILRASKSGADGFETVHRSADLHILRPVQVR